MRHGMTPCGPTEVPEPFRAGRVRYRDRSFGMPREERNVVQNIDRVPHDRCPRKRRSAFVGCVRRRAEPSASQLSAAERWLETGTRWDGGHILCAVSCHPHSVGNLHVGWIDQLSVACWVPGQVPPDGVARSHGQGRGAPGPVRHRRGRIRRDRLLAARGALRQGWQRVCDSEPCPVGQSRAHPGRPSLLVLSVGPIARLPPSAASQLLSIASARRVLAPVKSGSWRQRSRYPM